MNSLRYNAHEFANDGPDRCFTVVLGVPCPSPRNLQATAYSGVYHDPAGWVYLGDVGRNISGETAAFSFTVPALSGFIVVVSEVVNDVGCGNYSLQVYGLPCPPPQLNIGRTPDPTKARLSWSTAYSAFNLQRAPSISGPSPLPFVNALMPVLVIDGDYTVEPGGADYEFFRLKQD